MEISEKITYLRKKKGWSQELLATKLEVSRQAVYKWEAGISLPEIDKLKKMSKLFEISFNELLDDEIDITLNSVSSAKDDEKKADIDEVNDGEKTKDGEACESIPTEEPVILPIINNEGNSAEAEEKDGKEEPKEESKKIEEVKSDDVKAEESPSPIRVVVTGKEKSKKALIALIACLVVAALAVGALTFFVVRSLLSDDGDTDSLTSASSTTVSSGNGGVDSSTAGSDTDTTSSSNNGSDTVDSGPLLEPGRQICTVTFETNGGTPIPSITVDKGGYVYGDMSTTRDGYVLTGWIDESTFKVWDFYNDVVEKDTTLQAVWRKAKSVTVTYYRTDEDSERFVSRGNELEPIKLAGAIDDGIERTYHAGWSTVPYGGVEYELEEEVNFDSDVELFAIWVVEATYHKNDGSSLCSTDCVLMGEEFEIPAHYQIGGAEFLGLSLEENGDIIYQVGDTLALYEPIDLYYVWSVPVTYHKNDGSGDTWVENVILGQSYVVDYRFIKGTDYKFEGWSKTETGSVYYSNEDEIASVGKALDFYAVWTVGVVYHTNDGDDRTVEERVRLGASYTIENDFSSLSPNSKNYSIVGWSSTPDGDAEYDSSHFITSIDRGYEVYAIWGIEIVYCNSDGVSLYSEKTTIGADYTVNYEISGNLLGWSTTLGADAEYKNGDVITSIQKSYKLYPVLGISVTYHHNDGSDKSYTVNVNAGNDYTVDYTFSVDDGLTFKGWALTPSPNYEDIVYKNGDVISSINASYELYAYLETVVTIYLNDGTEEYGTYKGALNKEVIFNSIHHSEENKAIMGWSTEPNGELVYGNSDAVVITNSLKLYAVWSDEGEFIFETDSDGYYTLVKYNGTRSVVHIPTRHTNGVPVTKIGANAFENNQYVEEIYASYSITDIGANAFTGCTKLKTVNIRQTANLDVTALNSCPALENILVDWNVNYSSIDGVLYNKEGTRLYKYPIGRTNKEYTVPNGTHIIGKYAFYNCKSLKKVVLPDGVGLVDISAFEGCSNMVSVDLGNNVNYIEGRAFYGCSSLKGIVFEHDLYTIGKEAFYMCVSLENVVAMGNVDLIVWHAFAECHSLSELTVYGTLTTAQDGAFENCPNFSEIKIIN